MIGPNPGTALTRTSPSLPAFLTTNHYSLTTAFSAQNSFMIRFRPKTGTSAALAEQTGPPAVPLASRTPLAPPPAAPKLQRRRDSAVLQPRSNSPSPPESDDRFFSGAANPVRRGEPTPLSFCSLAPPFTSSPAHFFPRSLLHSSTFSLVHLFPRSLAPLFPWSLVPCRGPRRQVFVAGVAWSLLFHPTPHAFGAHPPCLSTHPLPQGLSGPRFLLQFPLFPWSLGPCFCPTPPSFLDPTPHAVL